MKKRILLLLTLAVLAAGENAWAEDHTVTYTITKSDIEGNSNGCRLIFTPDNTGFSHSTGTKVATIDNLQNTSGFSVALDDGVTLDLGLTSGSRMLLVPDESSENYGIAFYANSNPNVKFSVVCTDYYITHVKMAQLDGTTLVGKGNPAPSLFGPLDLDVDIDKSISNSYYQAWVIQNTNFGRLTITLSDAPRLSIFEYDSTNDYYKIKDKHSLRQLADIVNIGHNKCSGLTFRQTQNITCDGNYTPIGSRQSTINTFMGTYDGQGHTVSGITVNRTGNDSHNDGFIGFFGHNSGVIENVVLASSTFIGYYNVGGIAGLSMGTIQNCRVENTVQILAGSAGAKHFGGIVGTFGDDYWNLVIGCVCAATVSCNDKDNCEQFGGIVGRLRDGAIRNCLYTGTESSVEAAAQKGAILGSHHYGVHVYNNYYTNINLGGVGTTGETRDEDGARRARTVTLGEGVTLVGEEAAYDVSGLTAIGTGNYALRYFDGTTTTIYSGETHKLTLSAPVGYTATYSVNGTAIEGNTFTMPDADVTVTMTSSSIADSWTLTATPATLLGESKYVTSFYTGNNAYQLPAGALAYIARLDGVKVVFHRIGENSDIIPNNTAVIIVSDAASITMTRLSSTTVKALGNILRGTDVAIARPSYGTVYVLGKDASGTLGFYRLAGNTIPAGKAYYVAQ